MDVAVAVGDEALYAVETPCAVFVLSGFEHNGLKIGACIGLGEVHGHGLTLADTGNETCFLIFVGKFINGLGAVLKTPEVFETCICAADDIGCHYVGGNREVETTEASGHCHAHQTCFAAGVKVGDCSVGIDCAAVGTGSALMIDTFSVFGY